MGTHFEPAERGLRDHVALWRRRAAIILGVAALVLAAALAASLLTTRQYQATASVLFPVEPAGQPGQDPTQVRFDPNRVIQTEAVVAAGDAVRARAEAEVGAGGTISARALKDTDIIFITATAPDAERAARLANAAAKAYVELRGDAGAAVGGVQVIEPARVPSAASSPALVRNLLAGLAIGLVVGLVAAYAVDHLDDTVADRDALERITGLPVLSTPVGAGPAGDAVRAVTLDDPGLATADGSTLLTSLAHAPGSDDARVLLVRRGARGAQVRETVEVLGRVGIEVVAAALVDAGHALPAGSQVAPPAASA